jgi:hypothetical protein
VEITNRTIEPGCGRIDCTPVHVALSDVLARQLRRRACKQAFHCDVAGGVAVDRERVESASEQVDEIPPGATASVEHPPAHV